MRQSHDDSCVRPADHGRDAARAKRGLGLDAPSSQCSAAPGCDFFGLARRNGPGRDDRFGHPSSRGRPQEVGARRIARLSILQRRFELHPGAVFAGHDRGRFKRCRAPDARQRRLLRTARRPLGRRCFVLAPVRHRHLFTLRQLAAARTPILDARKQSEQHGRSRGVLQQDVAALLYLHGGSGDQRSRHRRARGLGAHRPSVSRL